MGLLVLGDHKSKYMPSGAVFLGVKWMLVGGVLVKTKMNVQLNDRNAEASPNMFVYLRSRAGRGPVIVVRETEANGTEIDMITAVGGNALDWEYQLR